MAFPYNRQKYNGPAHTVNGSPLTFGQALKFASGIRFWHGAIANTGSWSQSNSQAELDSVNLALGLVEMLSDPGAVERLMMVGEVMRERIDTVLSVEDREVRWENLDESFDILQDGLKNFLMGQ